MVNYPSNPETISTSDLSGENLVGGANGINIVEVIETVINSLDQTNSAMVSHNDSGNVWKFKYGSVEAFVQLTGTTDDDTFTAWATVLTLPAKNEPQLMRKLLEMNWKTTFESAFAIFENQVVVLSSRTVAELSPGEISRLITVVATIADDNDDALQAEFAN